MAVEIKTLKDSKILVVDDNPSNVLLLEALLQQEDYHNISSTTDPTQVRSLHEENDFDLILLDIQMPRMNGFEVMEQLKEHHAQDDYLPVLVLTAQTDMETRLRSLDLGARDFVTKPFQHAEVLQRIHNSLEIRHLYKQQKEYSHTLEEKVHEATAELRKSQLDIIRCLGRAGEYRDNETGEHVIRMSKSCQALALACGLSERHAEQILYASPMHDVGKIGIADNILLKPGKLTPEEWKTMQTHAQLGAGILADNESETVQLARTIALSHHEKWDGTGYPNGLSGEDIPMEGRIAAICDVFDALTSWRPYKKAWTVDEAIAFLNENAGTHFDPNLVPKFVEILPQVLEIRDEHQDTIQEAV
ncbi:Response regulator receiver modulated metal dependent phosphohydrolase [Candidatus Terasakiella magnetica]|uniref:Response regulator receiver modulated metal dependent phosphohydrolase n=1 Tax=Candidatus Terasakiella magnetica TaxID=1867952 RepID=A0A1C3RDH6_9PROT|nr:HD domain-containing phosphohydrolase [Candidatus Terasakiella magnetica]SCA55336.1 Response regulator receiver modulated metal dependent phosphohydrolase [Candidatus Terasakiella magnetica]